MSVNKKLMGFEGQLFFGAAGNKATTLATPRDVSYGLESTEADISDRGSIFDLFDVAGIGATLEIELNNKQADAFRNAVRTALLTGGAIALLTLDEEDGFGVDGDFILSLNEEQNLRDAQRLNITARPTDKAGRLPNWGTHSSPATTTTTAGG